MQVRTPSRSEQHTGSRVRRRGHTATRGRTRGHRGCRGGVGSPLVALPVAVGQEASKPNLVEREPRTVDSRCAELGSLRCGQTGLPTRPQAEHVLNEGRWLCRRRDCVALERGATRGSAARWDTVTLCLPPPAPRLSSLYLVLLAVVRVLGATTPAAAGWLVGRATRSHPDCFSLALASLIQLVFSFITSSPLSVLLASQPQKVPLTPLPHHQSGS